MFFAMSALSKPQQALAVDFSDQRRNMVECQLRPNKIIDERILGAMATLPRERFVPAAAQSLCYGDEDVPLGQNRFLPEPMVFAKMLQAAAIKPQDRILEIGCATGYGTAVLVSLSHKVFACDEDKSMVANAGEMLRQLQLPAEFFVASPQDGLPAAAPYDVIIVNGAAAELPSSWFEQLAQGGRLLVVLRSANPVPQAAIGVAQLYLKEADQISHQTLFDAQTPYLPSLYPRPQFTF
jgi:protein-L-isoaspartate(D-aspartate) O-methyltransferase